MVKKMHFPPLKGWCLFSVNLSVHGVLQQLWSGLAALSEIKLLSWRVPPLTFHTKGGSIMVQSQTVQPYEHLARCGAAEHSALCGTNPSQHDGCWALVGAWAVHPWWGWSAPKADEALSCLQASVHFQNRARSRSTLPFLKIEKSSCG